MHGSVKLKFSEVPSAGLRYDRGGKDDLCCLFSGPQKCNEMSLAFSTTAALAALRVSLTHSEIHGRSLIVRLKERSNYETKVQLSNVGVATIGRMSNRQRFNWLVVLFTLL